jgi:hypothetical protein
MKLFPIKLEMATRIVKSVSEKKALPFGTYLEKAAPKKGLALSPPGWRKGGENRYFGLGGLKRAFLGLTFRLTLD